MELMLHRAGGHGWRRILEVIVHELWLHCHGQVHIARLRSGHGHGGVTVTVDASAGRVTITMAVAVAKALRPKGLAYLAAGTFDVIEGEALGTATAPIATVSVKSIAF